MVNYQLGKIYKIVCNITDECYIGSTCQPSLAQRLTKHVSGYKRFKAGKISSKCRSYSMIDRGNYNIYLIESYPCNSRDELIAREGGIIKQYKLNSKCVNHHIAGRTKKEYILDNKDTIQEKLKQYRLNNKEKLRDKSREYRKLNTEKVRETNKKKNEKYKDKIKIMKKEWYLNNKNTILEKSKEKITCICGSCICKRHKARHERSAKHTKYINTIQ